LIGIASFDYISKYLFFSIPVNFVLFIITAWTIPFNVKSNVYIHDDEVSRGMVYKKNLKYFPLLSLIFVGLLLAQIYDG
jgi:hypothetical protein